MWHAVNGTFLINKVASLPISTERKGVEGWGTRQTLEDSIEIKGLSAIPYTTEMKEIQEGNTDKDTEFLSS